jgi:hypothetical protein
LKFCVETGGILSGDIVGSIQNGKVMFQHNGKDYDGSFASQTVVEGAWADGTPCNFTLNKC